MQTESILSSLNDIEVDISLQPIVKYLIQCLNEVKENHRHLDIIRTTVCQLLESWKREDKENEKETEEGIHPLNHTLIHMSIHLFPSIRFSRPSH